MTPELRQKLALAFTGLSIPTTGVVGVAGVVDVSRYARKPPEIRPLRPLRPEIDERGKAANEGVSAGVAEPLDADAEVDAVEERAALVSCPAPYRDTFARLNHQKPFAVSDAEWRLALDDAGLFLDTWGADAAELGLTPGDLFDVRTGIVWRLAGGRVEALVVDADGVDHVRLADGRTIMRKTLGKPTW